MTAVEFSTSCWERTYRTVLAPGFVERIVESMGDPFATRVVVINNVDDLPDAVERAEALKSSGEITGYRLVSRHIEEALRRTGLRERDLAPLPHYTDHLLVAVTGDGPPFLCHWDADCVLTEPVDWVTPTVRLLEAQPDVLAGMPGWQDAEGMEREQVGEEGPFHFGYGLSDHVFLVERARLARPIYRYISPASWWYPTSHLTPIFEQRVDAYMRRNHLRLAAFRGATYFHDSDMVWQPDGGYRGRLKRKARTVTAQALRRLPAVDAPWLVRK